jgi:mannosyltransferase
VPEAPWRRNAAPLGALIVLAVLLRLPWMSQSLALDEVFTYREIHGQALSDLFPQMRANGENTPPFYYLLAWFAAQLGDTVSWTRVPSLVLSVATVPVVYLLAARTVGPGPGLLAAALFALSPFAIFFGSEARAYATAMFACGLSTLVLLRALMERSLGWWAAYAVCTAVGLYTHYMAAFVLAAQALWALATHRGQWRELVATQVVAGAALVPWLVTARGQSIQQVFGGSLELRVAKLQDFVALFPGQPYSHLYRPSLERFPGVLALVLVGAGLVVALAAVLAARRAGGRPPADAPPHPLALIGAVASAAPVGVVAYSLLAHDLLLSRYLSPSLPALLVLAGWLLLRPPRRIAALATVLTLAGMAIAAARMGDEGLHRPQQDEVAALIRAQTGPGDTVLDVAANPLIGFFSAPVRAYLRGERAFAPWLGDRSPQWSRVADGGRVAVVTPIFEAHPVGEARAGPGGCFRRLAFRRYQGVVTAAVAVYGQGRGTHACLAAPRTEFGHGFSGPEADATHHWRWAVAPSARLELRHRSGGARSVRLSATLARPDGRPGRILIRPSTGPTQAVRAGPDEPAVAIPLRLQPGLTSVVISTDAPPVQVEPDPRPLYFRVIDLSVGGREAH